MRVRPGPLLAAIFVAAALLSAFVVAQVLRAERAGGAAVPRGPAALVPETPGAPPPRR
jgi:hypothetical protein